MTKGFQKPYKRRVRRHDLRVLNRKPQKVFFFVKNDILVFCTVRRKRGTQQPRSRNHTHMLQHLRLPWPRLHPFHAPQKTIKAFVCQDSGTSEPSNPHCANRKVLVIFVIFVLCCLSRLAAGSPVQCETCAANLHIWGSGLGCPAPSVF